MYGKQCERIEDMLYYTMSKTQQVLVTYHICN